MWSECSKSNFLNVTQITHSLGVFLTAWLLIAGNSPLRTNARPHSQWKCNSVVLYIHSIGLCEDQMFGIMFSVSTKSQCTLFLYLSLSLFQREHLNTGSNVFDYSPRNVLCSPDYFFCCVKQALTDFPGFCISLSLHIDMLHLAITSTKCTQKWNQYYKELYAYQETTRISVKHKTCILLLHCLWNVYSTEKVINKKKKSKTKNIYIYNQPLVKDHDLLSQPDANPNPHSFAFLFDRVCHNSSHFLILMLYASISSKV